MKVKQEVLDEKTGNNFTRMYIFALTAVALLTLTGQFLIQSSISSQISDSHVVNLAGKQRFKSQEIVKLCLILYANLDHIEYKDKIKELKNLVEYWEKNHLGLRYGNKDLNLPGKNSAKTEEMYDAIDQNFYSVLNGALTIINLKENPTEANQTKMDAAIRRILSNERTFLNGMDEIVHQYDVEAQKKMALLRKIEHILLIITLIILIFEGLFIFRPAVLQIKLTIRELILSEEKTSDLAQKLTTANKSLERSIRDLQDIHFALDHASIVAKTDKYGIITYVNDKFCEISKYKREELLGNRFHMISGHYHSKQFFDRMWETISSGKLWNDEIKNKAKDGSFFWLDTTIVPVLSNDGSPGSYIAIYTDITQKFKQSINEQKIRTSSIIEGQEKERKKIARELHDGLGQKLTALKFNIEGLKGAASKNEKSRLTEIKNMLYETIVEVRRISFNLMPSVLSDFGIIPALKNLSEQVSKSSNIDVVFENESNIQRLNKTVEINIYRITQEALNNAIKYAEADEVTIFVSNSDTCLTICISDNGKGFNTSYLDSKVRSVSSGNGIVNIQERTSLINGEFRIETGIGKGTKIMIKVPIVNA